MKRAAFRAVLIAAMLALFSPGAWACVGKTLNVGVLNSVEGQLFAEMLSTLINERTGTTVKVSYYKDEQDLYGAIEAKKVDISIENTARAMQVLRRPADADARRAFEEVKAAYEQRMGLVWLRPFGFLRGGGSAPSYTAAVLRMEVVNNFPALPRVINKLGSTINDATYTRLIRSVQSGEAPKTVARDFLRSKKII